MKPSEFGKTVRLARTLISDELADRGGEIALESPAVPEKSAAAPAPAPAAQQVAVLPPTEDTRTRRLEEFRARIAGCTACGLSRSRLNVVFGTGSAEAKLMFVGEGPGFDEDHQGEPFVGRAGQLLNKIIEAIGLTRSAVYIANIVKCHPVIDPTDPEKRGNDRPPSPEETQACFPYLKEQIAIIQPRCICTLGNSATRTLLGVEGGISSLRGKFFEFQGTRLMPTYHPAALLRNPSLKRDVWEDMKLVRDFINNP